jgi:hypothetical protein
VLDERRCLPGLLPNSHEPLAVLGVALPPLSLRVFSTCHGGDGAGPTATLPLPHHGGRMADVTESEFQQHLEWLAEETSAALAVYDTYEELNRLARDRNDIQVAMLADYAFWQVQLGVLQGYLFVILGRLFDKRSDAHSISEVLGAAQKNIVFFSHEALSRRKREGGPKPSWLDEYLRTAWVPKQATFAALAKSLEKHSQYYRRVYRPIRNSHIAHRSLKPPKSVGEMFGQTNRKELGEMLVFLRDLAGVIRQAFLNGRPPVLGETNYESDRTKVQFAVQSVLEKLTMQPFSDHGKD